MEENAEEKEFPFADVLDIAIDRVISNGISEVLEFMTGDNLLTSQFPGAAEKCRPYLIKQHPLFDSEEMREAVADFDERFKGIGVEDKDIEKRHQIVQDWLAVQIEKYGKTIKIKPIPPGSYESKDPIEEAVKMMGGPEKVSVRVVEY